MKELMIAIVFAVTLFLPTLLPAQNTAAGDGIIEPGENPEEELAKAAQNPVANMISLPLQNNTNFNFGPREKTQNVLNIQPVWPFTLNENWTLITRTIMPVVSQPQLFPGDDRETGIWSLRRSSRPTGRPTATTPGPSHWGVVLEKFSSSAVCP